MLHSSPIDPDGRISRHDLALNRPVWLTYGCMFIFVAVATAAIPLLWPQFSLVRLELFAVALLAVGVVAVATPPPAIGTWQNHVALASIPSMTAIGIIAFSPYGIVPVAAAVFAGTFTAGRLQDRRHLLAHYLAGALIMLVPLLVVDLDPSTTFAVLSVIPGIWVLGYCTMLILEAAEAQGDELERLVRRDPLTGIGNRRLLAERLDAHLLRSRRGERPLAVLALDLDGFKCLNDEIGHDAGDRVLQRVADAISATIRPGDTAARQGGDEFCVLLPDTSAEGAAEIATELRVRLASLEASATPITTGIGIAVYPVDATTGTGLLNVADDRLCADKSRPGTGSASSMLPGPRPIGAVPAVLGDRRATGAGLQPTRSTRVSREDIAVHRTVWIAIGAMTSLYALVAIGLTLSVADRSPAALPVCLTLALVAAIVVLSEPPPLRSWLNHVVIAIPYAGSIAFAFVLPEYSGGMFGALAFSGTLTAVRLVGRPAIAAHLTAATGGIALLAGFGGASTPSVLALLLMIAVIWASGFGALTFLEVAEHQGAELERLVRRDPLTGIGNRRLLDERLDLELRRHARTRRPLTVLALDLNGFKALNDRAGHAAGDDLLKAIAEALQRLTSAGDTVVRQGGDEFCVVLPETSAAGAVPIANAIRVAVEGLGTPDHPISTGIGPATFPIDSTAADVLMHVADRRLREDKGLASSTRAETGRRGDRSSPLQRYQ